ncbi:duplicated orphan permease [Spirosomataceae bacterium TFI 002]|nr:duplicated orphan permease [Spirosomataceae bacterium TFI 002]
MLKNYFKIAIRSLKKNKTYGFINVIGLTLSIASGILLFTFINFHLDFDSFHSDSDRIYRIVTEQKRDVISYQASVPPALGIVVRENFDFDENIARTVKFSDSQITYADNKKIIEEAGIYYAESDFFNIFNFPFLEGSLTKEFEEPNKAFLTESIAKKYFGEASAAIGQTLKIDNNELVTVIAILKDVPENSFLENDIFVSYASLKKNENWYVAADSWSGISSSLQCFAKLKPGVNPEQLEQSMAPFPAKYRPESSNVHTYKMQPINDWHFNANYNGPMPKRTLWILGIIGLFLLISACLNFINLATAQVMNRLKEVGVRKSLGSRKSQLFGQFLTETAIIALCATIIALGLAVLMLPQLNQLFETSISTEQMLNFNLVAFVFAVFAFATFISGTYPGILLSKFQPIAALKGKLSNVNVAGLNLRKALIVTQFMISQVLIIGMLVIVKQMRFNQQKDLGFNKEALVMLPIPVGQNAEDKRAFKERLLSQSSILNSTICFTPPASNSNWGASVQFKGKDEQEDFRMNVKGGDEDYLKTFGLELVAGRNIRRSDTLNEILVNQTFLKKMNFASPDEAIGKYMEIAGENAIPIVGVIKDFHDQSMHSDISAIGIGSHQDVSFSYAVKLNPANMSDGLKAIENVWNSVYPDNVFTYEFVDESIKEFYETEQRLLSLIQLFTAIAIFIGAMGLYGLVSFMVERKTKEIGVRKVLGGSVANILWLFGKEFAALIVVSFLIAAPLAWYLSTAWLQDFTFRVPVGAELFIAALVLTVLIATVSVSFKVIRAALVNPVVSLKSE